MRATLQFNLPDEEIEFKIASTAMDWALALSAIDQELRLKLKHGLLSDDTKDELEWARRSIQEELESRNLSFGMIE